MWRYAAAKNIGTSHIRVGLPCQDRFICELLPDGTLIAALADGAGSAELSDVGAEIAVSTVLQSAKSSLLAGRRDFANLLCDAADIARQAIFAEADRESRESRDYASTLLGIVLTPDGGGALQLGDGALIVSDAASDWSPLFWPQHGEYANTTLFLTELHALSLLQTASLPPTMTDFAMMSDGLEPLALVYATREAHQPFLAGMLAPLHAATGIGECSSLSQSLQTFLASDRVAARTDDDVSLIMATRRTVFVR